MTGHFVVLLALAAGVGRWETLEPGLDLAEIEGPPAGIGDRRISVLRVDPARFSLALANASAEPAGRAQTARQWAARMGALAAINASMFLDDGRTSVGLMRTRRHSNNPRASKDNAILLFDALDGGVPALQILDRTCQDEPRVSARYGAAVQSIRMISCDRRNVWSPGPKRWSTAAIGVDGAGRALFIHARTPWPVHDLVDALLRLPLDLRRAMYVEGGPEAQLFVRAGGQERELVGSYETGFNENDENRRAWPVPNVVLVLRGAR